MRKLIVNEPQTEGRRGVTSSSSTLEDVRVGVRLKISALWIAMLFLFAYGDIFGFFNPDAQGCSSSSCTHKERCPRIATVR